MLKQLIFLFTIIFLFSCNQKKKDPNFNDSLPDVKNEMNFLQVEDLAGKPTSIEDLGVATSETGDTTHLVQWFYGSNQSVMFTNGKVSGVELDIKATQDRIQHIMDSAKAAGGENGGAIIQPQR